MEKIINNNVAIDKFKSDGNPRISYKELSNIPLNEIQQIIPDNPGAIECIRITSNEEDCLMFSVTMKKNQTWIEHDHDCQELCVVFSGELEDVLSNKKAGPANSLYFKKNTPHYIVANKDTIFYVKFNKPK